MEVVVAAILESKPGQQRPAHTGEPGLLKGRFRAPPGEHCLAPRGAYFPVIDRNRCEGGGECSRVCPERVFEVRTIDGQDHDQLSFLGRMRSALHGRKSAYTPNASHCLACGLCVDACPEQAISLVTFG
jgi:NAD-dependent dihydropyrimidine dehydrogenase PreA subunit